MTISAKVESAFAQLVTSLALDGLSVYTGINDATKDVPNVVISVQGITEDFPQSGIWHAKTRIEVSHMAADTAKEDADTVADAVFAAALDTGVAVTLTGLVEGFEVYDVFMESMDEDTQDDAWVKSLALDVICTNGGN